jgi:hypothetical protein
MMFKSLTFTLCPDSLAPKQTKNSPSLEEACFQLYVDSEDYSFLFGYEWGWGYTLNSLVLGSFA